MEVDKVLALRRFIAEHFSISHMQAVAFREMFCNYCNLTPDCFYCSCR